MPVQADDGSQRQVTAQGLHPRRPLADRARALFAHRVVDAFAAMRGQGPDWQRLVSTRTAALSGFCRCDVLAKAVLALGNGVWIHKEPVAASASEAGGQLKHSAKRS